MRSKLHQLFKVHFYILAKQENLEVYINQQLSQ